MDILCNWRGREGSGANNHIQFGQELLSTFGTQIGEIALIPATGGLFTVELVRLVPYNGMVDRFAEHRLHRPMRLRARRSLAMSKSRKCSFGIEKQNLDFLVCIPIAVPVGVNVRLTCCRDESPETACQRSHRSRKGSGSLGSTRQEEGERGGEG